MSDKYNFLSPINVTLKTASDGDRSRGDIKHAQCIDGCRK